MPADPSNLTRQPDKSNTVAHTPEAEVLHALKELLAACIVEYGDPDDGAADESVGWKGDGSEMPFKYGHMQRARAAILRAEGGQ